MTTATLGGVRLHVPGKPVPMPRPRVTRFGTYHSKPAQAASKAVARAWREAGEPRVPDGPLCLDLAVVVLHPKTHLLKDGSLSAAGRSAPPYPGGDLDNYLKLPLDALNGLAWRDDSQIVTATVRKAWAPLGHDYRAGLFLHAWPAPALETEVAVEMAVQEVLR